MLPRKCSPVAASCHTAEGARHTDWFNCAWLSVHALTRRSMALKTDKVLKVYYSIKEVAAEFDINESTLRYWEKEFPFLKPKVGGNNVRQYTEKDKEQIRLIYNLVKVRGLKIAAARKYLSQNRDGAERSSEVLDTLISVRDQLKELKKQLDALV